MIYFAGLPVVPPAPEVRHHPTMCVLTEPSGTELLEDGTLLCPHGVADEDDAVWRNRRNQFVCDLLMELLTEFDHNGWPIPNSSQIRSADTSCKKG